MSNVTCPMSYPFFLPIVRAPRADRAIDTLLTNGQRFGVGPQQISRSQISLRYLRTLPTTDAENINQANVTSAPLKAGFVEVTANPVSFDGFFTAAAAAVLGQMTTGASAVAELRS